MADRRSNTTITGPLIGPDSRSFRDEQSSYLIEDARERIREQDDRNKEGVKLARRLIVAFILILILGVVFYAVLPRWGLRLPPIVPALSFVAILIGAVLSAMDQHAPDDREDRGDTRVLDQRSCKDDGCAVGMCSGPRPLRMFRDDPKRPKG